MTKEDDGLIHAALVTGNMQITAQMASGKTMTISSYTYEGESLESVNSRASLLQDAIDFQRKRSEIPDLVMRREQMITNLANMRDALVGIQQKPHPSNADKVQVQNIETSIGKIMADIQKGADEIDKARKEVGL